MKNKMLKMIKQKIKENIKRTECSLCKANEDRKSVAVLSTKCVKSYLTYYLLK